MATAPALKTPAVSSTSRMAALRATAEGNGVKYGLYTATALVLYLAIAAIAGFLGSIEASALNGVIIMAGVVLSIRHLSMVKGRKFGYLQGYGTGIITAIVASALLGAAFWLLGGISQQAIAQIRTRDLFGSDLGVLISGLGIILMGTMTGVITALIAMQYYRSPDEEQFEMKDNEG
jgi:ABC-type transport system involved in cytochrome bd biosynthesis fused ATPase/permease subunit